MGVRLWHIEEVFRPLLALGIQKDLERADRHTVRLPLEYRAAGESAWRRGEIGNVNVQGVLFRCPDALPQGSLVEVNFKLPHRSEGAEDSEVFFWGEVVRVEQPADGPCRPALAVKVLRYRSTPEPPLDVRPVTGEVRGPVAGRSFRDNQRWKTIRCIGNQLDDPALPSMIHPTEDAGSAPSDETWAYYRAPISFGLTTQVFARRSICLWADPLSGGESTLNGRLSCPLGRFLGLCPDSSLCETHRN